MPATRLSVATVERIAELWPRLLADIAEARAGVNVKDLLAHYGVSPHVVRAYRVGNAQADKAWQLAREQRADTLFDELLDTANNREDDPAHARVKCDVLKWAIVKFNPRLYGDRSQVDLNVKTVDLTRIIQDANARLAASRTFDHSDIAALL